MTISLNVPMFVDDSVFRLPPRSAICELPRLLAFSVYRGNAVPCISSWRSPALWEANRTFVSRLSKPAHFVACVGPNMIFARERLFTPVCGGFLNLATSPPLGGGGVLFALMCCIRLPRSFDLAAGWCLSIPIIDDDTFLCEYLLFVR